MKHLIRSAARDDVLRQFRYYLVDQNVPEVARRFVEAVEAAIEQIVQMPAIGAPKHLSNKALLGLRSWRVHGFEDIRIYFTRWVKCGAVETPGLFGTAPSLSRLGKLLRSGSAQLRLCCKRRINCRFQDYLVQGVTLRVVRVLHGKRDIKQILERELAEDEICH